MKKSFMVLFCVVLCMFAFTAGVSATSAMDELTAVDLFGATMDCGISGVTPFADGDGSSDENAKKGSYQISVTTDGNGKYLGSEFIEKRESDGMEMYWVYVLPNDGYELYATAKDSGTATKVSLTLDNFATWTDGVTEEPNAMRFKVGLAADASYAVTFQQIYRFLITSNVEWAASSEDTEKPYLELSNINPNYKVLPTSLNNQTIRIANYAAISDNCPLDYVEIDGLKITVAEFMKCTSATAIDLSGCDSKNTRTIKIRYNNGKILIMFNSGGTIVQDYHINFVFKEEQSAAQNALKVTAGEHGSLYEAKHLVDGEDGSSKYEIYAEPNMGYHLESYTIGDKTVSLASEDKTCTTVTDGGVEKEVVSFPLTITGDTELQLNFAEGFEKSRYFAFAVPGEATLSLTRITVKGNTYLSDAVEPAAIYKNAMNGMTVYKFADQGTESCIFRVSGDGYLTYAGTVFVKESESMTVTGEMLQSTEHGVDTLDRNAASHGGYNLAGIYTNINEAGYLKMPKVGDQYQITSLRDWWISNYTWSLGVTYKQIQPDYRYTVLDMNGKVSDSVVSIDEKGLITAKGNGSAIVLVSYDSINIQYAEGDKEVSKYKPDGFWGALWPENTGVFVVSVGAGESNIETGTTIEQPNETRAVDAEYDVIYFTGERGEYSFTPKTEGVTVSVANPAITDYNRAGTLTYSGFDVLAAKADGSYDVPLTDGRNIIKIEKDGKAEYQVITAKKTNVTVNGMALDECYVCPGDDVVIQFDALYNPQNRNQYINSDAGAIYHSISGMEGKKAGFACGPYGFYTFVSDEAKHTIAHFVKETDDGSEYANPMVATDGKLTVPADYSEESFVLSDGSFRIVGWGRGLETFRATEGGFVGSGSSTPEDEDTGGLAPAVSRYLCALPEISIPVVSPEKIEVTAMPDKTSYKLGEDFDPAGMVVEVTYSNGKTMEITDYSCSQLDSMTVGKKAVTVSYTVGGVTKTTEIEVNVTELDDDEILAYVSYSYQGKIVTSEDTELYKAPVIVTDLNEDGKFTMNEAFIAFHDKYYENGSKGYSMSEGSGWIVTFWGRSANYVSYVRNNAWVYSALEEIEAGDALSLYDYADRSSFSDLYTWFEKDTDTATVGVEKQFRLNGLNVMNDSGAYPEGATVTVYDENGQIVEDFATKTAKDGTFAITFSVAGTYRIVANGKCNYTCEGYGGGNRAYTDAVVVPSCCTVKVSEAPVIPVEPVPPVEPGVEVIDPADLPFTDLTENWYKDAIAYVYSYELMNGMSATTFEPSTTLTRAMVATILYRMEGEPAVNGNNPFGDVKNDVDGAWYYNAVLWATQNGIVTGYEDNTFRPVREITREEMAAMMYRYADYKGLDVSATADFAKFSDGATVSNWAKPYMSWAVGVNLITGHDNGTLEPQGTATRAQAATVLMRFNEMVK